MVRKFTPEPGPVMDLRGWEKDRSSLHAQERPGSTLGQDKLGPNINPWWDAPLFPPWAGGDIRQLKRRHLIASVFIATLSLGETPSDTMKSG